MEETLNMSLDRILNDDDCPSRSPVMRPQPAPWLPLGQNVSKDGDNKGHWIMKHLVTGDSSNAVKVFKSNTLR